MAKRRDELPFVDIIRDNTHAEVLAPEPKSIHGATDTGIAPPVN